MAGAPPLPTAVLQHLARLRAGPARKAAALRALVSAHADRARTVAASDPFVDLTRALEVADGCLALIDALPKLKKADRSWVKAACLYFADPDDEEDDFSSVVGFDDDAEVVNYVADLLGLDIRIDLD